MVAVGISAIGDVQGAFVQNVKKLPAYGQAIAAGRFPVEKGYALSADDTLRRHVISELMCNARLDLADVSARFGRPFAELFAVELAELGAPGGPIEDGMVELTPGWIRLTPLGRRFVRNVAMIFDRHLREGAPGEKPVFSRTV
jgi:oxygen-independent coproporphyrinogen-3 oxidase